MSCLINMTSCMCPGSRSGHAITANDNWSPRTQYMQVHACGPTKSWACVDKAIHMLQEAQTILYMCILKKNSGKCYNKNKPYIVTLITNVYG